MSIGKTNPVPGRAALAIGALLTITLAYGETRAADTPTVDAIAAKIAKERAAVQSIFVELHDHSTISVPADVLLSWPDFHNLLALVDQRHEFAFKGAKRYWLEERLNPPRMLRKSKPPLGQPNSCRGDNGQTSWNRALAGPTPGRAFNLSVFRSRPDRQWVPTPDYFGNIGWLNTDPHSQDKYVVTMQALDLLELLKHHELRVTDENVKLGDANCVVLQGDTEQSIDLGKGLKTIKTHQTFWLDFDHGFAVRQHEHRSELGFGRVVNSDFVEATPGFWLPKKTELETFAPANAAKEYQDRPVFVVHSDLNRWEINAVSDDLFDPVTKPGDRVYDQRSMPRE
jgi:hypothetical protein